MIRILALLRNRKFSWIQSRQGFSLVDVLIAMVILLIAIASSTALAVQLARTMQVDQRLTDAANLADYKLEEIRNMAYVDVVDGSDTSTMDSMGGSPGRFTRAWTVAVDTPVAGLKTVTVTVTWDQWDGTETYDLTGVISR